MSASLQFTNAEAVLFDPIPANGESLRASLQAIGFGNTEVLSVLNGFIERLGTRTPDLLIAELGGSESELCSLFQDLRRGKIGTNPFVVVVLATWRRDGTLIAHAINAGADDLLARPFSTSLLAERLRMHTERRKNFVVTSDYIGPDRRRDPRPDDKGSLFEAPNSLRMKAMNSIPDLDATIADAIAKAKEVIESEKMKRDAIQLCLQWRLIERRALDSRSLSDMLEQMSQLAGEISRRAGDTDQKLASKWCDSIENCAQAIGGMLEFNSEGNPTHAPALAPMLHLLGHSALTLGQMFSRNTDEGEFVAELDAIAARFDVRHTAYMA
ncbi:MAG: hypothetical protein ACT4OG_04870 [Alphaproteobacteria bacterium]